MSKSFVVRKYQPIDMEQCRGLWRELTEWHREIYQDPNIGGAHPEDYFDKQLAKVGPDNLWVAVQDSSVVGLVGLMTLNDELEIEPLIVSKTHRGKGVGKSLIATVIAEARDKGLRYLNVSPVARNTNAIQFLYEQGFRNLGHVQMFIDFSDYKWKQGPELFSCKFKF